MPPRYYGPGRFARAARPTQAIHPGNRFATMPDAAPPGAIPSDMADNSIADAARAAQAAPPAAQPPLTHPGTMGAYQTPQASEQALRQAGQTAEQIRKAAMNYIQQQLKTYRLIAPLTGDEQFNGLATAPSAGSNLQDLYTQASRRLTELAKAAGYADPRMYLRDLARRARTPPGHRRPGARVSIALSEQASQYNGQALEQTKEKKRTKGEDERLVNRVIRAVEDAKHAYHDQFCYDVDRRYKLYRGHVDRDDEMPDWMSQVYPAHAFQMVETIVANLIDDELYFSTKPRPRISSGQSAQVGELQRLYRAAMALETLLRIDQDIDRFTEKQRPIVLQNSIAGVTCTKDYWRYAQGVGRSYERKDREVHDEYGNVIARVPALVETTAVEDLHDNSCVEPVDMRDLFWPEGAKTLPAAEWVCHRVWMLIDELYELEALGVYSDVDKIKGTQSQEENERGRREQDIFNQMRAKGFVEVLEYWHRSGEVITVGNRKVLLRYLQKNPFRHGTFPFTLISSMPDLFRIGGISDVELVEPLQKAIWTLRNQQLDSVRLLNNAIVLIASDVEDPDAFVFAPMERWLVDSVEQVKILEMNSTPAEVATPAIERLMGDMQNVTGGMPFMAGAESSQVDQQTATGISIVTSLAQRRLQARKQNFSWGFARMTERRIELIQQFMLEPQLVPRIGHDGTMLFLEVFPEEVQGRFMVEVRSMSESMMRQERRAEAQALFQIFLQAAPAYAAMGRPLNPDAWLEDLLEAFGRYDTDYYLSQAQQPAMAQAGQPGGAPPAGELPGGMNMGTTAETAVDASAPSTTGGISQSPAQFQARAQAMTGPTQ